MLLTTKWQTREQNHVSARAHREKRFLELKPELIKCENSQFARGVIIIPSHGKIPRHRDVSAHASRAKRPHHKQSNEA